MKIFLAGSVSFADQSQIKKYELYEKILKKKFKKLELITPNNIWQFRENLKLKNPKAKEIDLNKEMVDFDILQVKTSDLIVCDLSNLSTGMGIELGVAFENNKKNIFFFEKGSYISNMILGAFHKSKFIMYENLNDLKLKLEENLN